MRSLEDILITLGNHKQYLYNNYPISSMAIFGSYSRNEQNEDSDLDIVVEFNDKVGIRFVDLADEIEGITGLHVDLVSKQGIKAKYLEAISQDLIYV